LLFPSIETQIDNLKDEIAEIESLKAGRVWLEQSEKAPGFIKHLNKTRGFQRYVPALYHPENSDPCLDQANRQTTAEYFYSQLYSPNPMDELALGQLLIHHLENLRLMEDQRDALSASITIEEIIQHSQQSLKQSSPGSNGLPYKILNLCRIHYFTRLYTNLIMTHFNLASFHCLRMNLLCLSFPKRVISLIWGIVLQSPLLTQMLRCLLELLMRDLRNPASILSISINLDSFLALILLKIAW
jgi:hypothetical protein